MGCSSAGGGGSGGGGSGSGAAVQRPSPVAARVLAEEAEGLLGPGGLTGAVEALVNLAQGEETGSLGARVCAAKAVAMVGGGAAAGKDQAVSLVLAGLGGRGVTVKGCVGAVQAVEGIVGGGAVEELREACAKVFPLAEAFGASSGGGTAAAAAVA